MIIRVVSKLPRAFQSSSIKTSNSILHSLAGITLMMKDFSKPKHYASKQKNKNTAKNRFKIHIKYLLHLTQSTAN